MESVFVIDKVSWHTKTKGNPEPRERIIKRFYAISKFLQDQGLAVRVLVKDPMDIQDDFSISSSDLTKEGLAVMKAAYDKWLRKIDEGMDVNDLSLIEKVLKKIRTK